MCVLHIGTDRTGRGGIASVISVYFSACPAQLQFDQLVTHRSGSGKTKLLTLLFAAFAIWPRLFSRRHRIFHFHVSSYASFYRKLPFFLLAKIFGKRTLVHIHSGNFDWFYETYSGPLGKWIIRSVLEHADTVIVLSERWATAFRAFVPAATIRVLYTPVSLPKQAMVARKKNQLLYLGRVSEAKGFWDLLAALVAVCAVKPDTVLLWGGDGETERAMTTAKALGLEHRSQHLGWVTGEEKQQLLDESTLLVLPSYREGLPVVVLEALANRLPVICTHVGGIPDVVKNHHTGLLLEPGDVNALSAAILYGLDNPAAMMEMADNGLALIEDKMTPERIIAELAQIYAELTPS